MKKTFSLLLLAASLFTACNDSSNADVDGADSMNSNTTADTSSAMNSAPAEQGVMVGGASMVPSKNIVENAAGSQDHTTLVAAVQAAGLAETLSGAGPFTVFAPTNGAFGKLPAGTVDNLLKPEMKNDLTGVLTYHVVPGALRAADLKDGQTLTTVQGAKLTVRLQNGTVMINDAAVTIPDVISSNGVTHVIDGVLLPK